MQRYRDGNTPAGIIYLHRITDNRMSGSAYKNLQLFGRLCGDAPLPRVRLVTTMWDSARDHSVGERREKELKSDFWKPLIDGGASTAQFKNTEQSAWDIVSNLARNEDLGPALLLQEEIVKQEKYLNETEAAKVLYSRLQGLLVDQKKKVKELADAAEQEDDTALAASLQEEYERLNELLEKTLEEMKAMKIALPRRFLLWLFGRKIRGVGPTRFFFLFPGILIKCCILQKVVQV